jgi:hypothetical protein
MTGRRESAALSVLRQVMFALSVLQRHLGASWAAWCDAQAGISGDLRTDREGRSSAWTPYMDHLKASADKTEARLLKDLHRREAKLISEINSRAAIVTEQREVRTTAAQIQRRRLEVSLARWITKVEIQRAVAEMRIATHNERLAVYWRVFSQQPHGLQWEAARGLGPARIVVSYNWQQPLELLPVLPSAGQLHNQDSLIAKAIEIVGASTT